MVSSLPYLICEYPMPFSATQLPPFLSHTCLLPNIKYQVMIYSPFLIISFNHVHAFISGTEYHIMRIYHTHKLCPPEPQVVQRDAGGRVENRGSCPHCNPQHHSCQQRSGAMHPPVTTGYTKEDGVFGRMFYIVHFLL